MKRFFAMVMIGVGAVVMVWGAYFLFTGSQSSQIPFTEYRVNPMYAGLAGLAALTLGLIGYRD